MAGRQQRRLQQQLEGGLHVATAEEEAQESTSEGEEEPSAAPFNPFSLLTDDEQGGAQEEEEEEEEEEQEVECSSSAAAAAQPPPGSGKRVRKKKKKKKQGSGGVAGRHGPSAAAADGSEGGGGQEHAATSAAAKQAEQDLDQILRDLNITPSVTTAAAAASSSSAAGTAAGARPLLALDLRFLKADEELKRMFGSKVVAEEDGHAAAYAGASRRVRRLAARGLLRRQQLKPGSIIIPKDHWPRFDAGVSLELQGATPDGKQRFGYAYSQAYQAVQQLYEECQATFDPITIAALLGSHPYHLDALLTMHDLHRSMGEHANADEMLERCVYALEMAWYPSFSPAAANALVAYEEANAPLFIALFRYLQSLSRRGLHRTALEVCKLLLGVNPDDPMGAAFYVDYLAIRAGRYDFLQRFAEEWGGDSSAALFPNVVFSLALGRWYQEQERPSNRGRGGEASSSRSGGGDAALSTSSEDLLCKAALMHPWAVVQLQRRLQEQGVGKDARWDYVLRQPLFAEATDGGSATLAHLVALFVERQHLLWKASPIQEWLQCACERAAEGRDPPSGSTAADWAAVRQQAFPPGTVNEYRHLRLHDFSDAVQRLPAEEVHGMGPAARDLVQIDEAGMLQELQGLAEQLERAAPAGARPQVPDEEMRAANPLTMLLRSLLPWVAAGQAPDYAEDDAPPPLQQEEGEDGG